MILSLKNSLVRITYLRRNPGENLPPIIHTITGIIRTIRRNSFSIEDQDGKRLSIGFKRLRGKPQKLIVKNEEIRAEIEKIENQAVFIDFDLEGIRKAAVGKIVKKYEHHFDFQVENQPGELYRIHFDEINYFSIVNL